MSDMPASTASGRWRAYQARVNNRRYDRMEREAAALPEIQMGQDGLPHRALIPSKSSPSIAPYVLERSVAGRWMHIDSRCPGWTNNGQCYHVQALEALNMTMEDEQATSTALAVNVLSQIDALDDQQVIQRLTGGLPAVTQRWVYRFPGVVGLSIDGVQEAARALATQGEAIEQVWVHMDDQNENEAFFTACAVRYAVSPTGQRVELDRAIRAKRQPKFTKLRAGGTQANEFWYEVGVAKALRNAVEALLPEAIKQHMINAAGKAAPKNGASTPTAAQSAERRAAQQPRTQEAAPKPADESTAVQAQILDDIKRARAEWGKDDFGLWAAQIRTDFPAAFDEHGKPAFTALDADALAALAARVRADVGEVPEMAL